MYLEPNLAGLGGDSSRLEPQDLIPQTSESCILPLITLRVLPCCVLTTIDFNHKFDALGNKINLINAMVVTSLYTNVWPKLALGLMVSFEQVVEDSFKGTSQEWSGRRA
jgi:hypothetical protein